MALISGFLKQTCQWTPRLTDEYDAYGQPASSETQTIKCRWEQKTGWYSGLMGSQMSTENTSYKSVVFVDGTKNDVQVGDTLIYSDIFGGTVQAVETVVSVAGKEEARKCYV